MQFTEEQICKMYREAKYPDKQITILSELNATLPYVIKSILYYNGVISKIPEVDNAMRKHRYTLTKDDEQIIIEKYKQGISGTIIAKELRLSEANVYKCLNDFNMVRSKTKIPISKLSDEQKSKIDELRQSGMGTTRISKQLGIGQYTVCKYLDVNGAGYKSTNPHKTLKGIAKVRRMEQCRKYYCGFCGNTFESEKDAKKCELEHIDLSTYSPKQIYTQGEKFPTDIIFTDKSNNSIIYRLHIVEGGSNENS